LAANPVRQCIQCASELGLHLSCPKCRELNVPAAGEGHFELLGMTPRFDLDLNELEARFLELSRELHPDYFQDRPDLRAKSVFLAASLNDAFDVLRDPFKRAEYLMQRAGGAKSSDDKRLPAGFLVEMMELRESLDEARESGDSERVQQSRRELESRRSESVEKLASLFRTLAASGAEREKTLQAIREELNVVNYLNSLRRDLLARGDARGEP
jgi:molecular chaperone HscB